MNETMIESPTGGMKGSKLARYGLIPPGPLRALAEHFGRNSERFGGKYPDRNWERGYSWSLAYDALLRHLQAWWAGESLDYHSLTDEQVEMGLPSAHHLDAVIWHAMVLRHFADRYPEYDDRPFPGGRLR